MREAGGRDGRLPFFTQGRWITWRQISNLPKSRRKSNDLPFIFWECTKAVMVQPQPKYPLVLSIGAALLTLALKGSAYWLSGSVSLLSDAMESVVNLLAAVVAIFCLWFASRPVDESHTYGHEKIEYFSSGLEGTMILIAAGGIAWLAVERLLNPRPLDALGLGSIIALGASLINLAVGLILLKVGKATQSIVMEADGKHLLTDVWTSVGVLIGLGLVWLTNVDRLDPIIALLVAANICWTAIDLIKRSFDGLMDHALPESEQATVRAAITAHLEPGTTFHALRTRQAGAHRFADFHLLVPGRLTVQRAHDLTGQIETAVQAALPGIEVTVHIEPIEEQAAWEDSALLPIEEAHKRH
jgi:cation diffusion facilitator family transporter